MSRESLCLKNEITKTLSSQGTIITFRKITQGAYDPRTGIAETESDIEIQAFVSRNATKATQRNFTGDYERSITVQLDIEPTKDDIVVYDSDEYNIVFIAPYIIDGLTIKYELLIKR